MQSGNDFQRRENEPIKQNQVILDIAEHAMGFGSWQYIIESRRFQCSRGMAAVFDRSANFEDATIFPDNCISEDLPIAKRIADIITNEHREFEEIIRIQARDSVKTIKVKGSLVRDQTQIPSAMVGVVSDITTLVASEHAYHEQAHLFSNILKTVPGLISVINLSTFGVEYVNRDLSFGLDETLPAPQDGERQMIHPDDGPVLKNYVKNFLSAGDDKVSTIEYRAKSHTGPWEWFRTQGKVFKRDANGVPTHSINVAQNINAAKIAEAESARIKETLAARARRQYEDLFRSIDQGFVIVELIYANKVAVDCLVLQANPAFEKITACRGITGRKLSDLLPTAPASWLQSLSEVIEQKKAHRFTVQAGELKGGWYDIYVFPTGEPGGLTVAVLFNDITERVRSAEELRDRQLKLDIAQRAGRVGVWTLDPITREGIATAEWRGLTGYQNASDSWRLENFLSLLEKEDVFVVTQAFAEAKANKGIEVECRIRHPRHGLKWFLMRGSYFPATNGEGDALMGSLIDITGQKTLEEQKDQFIAIASHELRTPVTSIRAYAELLLDFLKGKGDPGHVAMMERMVSQTTRLTRLINDLLDTTKIAAGALSLDPEPVDLNDVIRQSIEEVQPSSRHLFTVNTSDIPTVSADKDRIRQVLANLLTNAIKYSREGSRITITPSRTEADVVVTVLDEGIGLAEETHEKIFERFYRIKSPENSAVAGFGLGLFIAHEIIHKHHGRLGVRSKPGEGAEFFFTLPIAPPAGQAPGG